jgi:hypothetical protein
MDSRGYRITAAFALAAPGVLPRYLEQWPKKTSGPGNHLSFISQGHTRKTTK